MFRYEVRKYREAAGGSGICVGIFDGETRSAAYGYARNFTRRRNRRCEGTGVYYRIFRLKDGERDLTTVSLREYGAGHGRPAP